MPRSAGSVRNLVVLTFLIGALASCDRDPRGPASSHIEAAAASQWYLDSAEACDFLKADINHDARALVDDYVRRDSEGEFLQSNPWLDSAYLCPGHLPGPDEFSAILGSVVTELDRSDTLVRFLNTSELVGDMTQDSIGFIFRPRGAVIVDTFAVRHTAFGWRIESPQLPDRVSRQWILSHANRLRFHGSTIDSLRLASRP